MYSVKKNDLTKAITYFCDWEYLLYFLGTQKFFLQEH